MRRLTLSINDIAAQALVRLAEVERRRPPDQAVILLERSIIEAATATYQKEAVDARSS